jgi:hypothetical protein
MKKRRILTILRTMMMMGEELNEAYKILYVEFEKLREARKQHIHDLNSV